MTVADAMRELDLSRRDDVAIAFASTLPLLAASRFARQIGMRLDEAGVPATQRAWIVASTGDDESAARLAAAISPHTSGARLVFHDPREPDGLTFQRRLPGRRRGGIYLNAAWQSASVRIGCGDAMDLVDSLSGWFNRRETLRAEDLHATLLL